MLSKMISLGLMTKKNYFKVFCPQFYGPMFFPRFTLRTPSITRTAATRSPTYTWNYVELGLLFFDKQFVLTSFEFE